MKSQPKALYLLNFVSMWECFSYYGMRILLVLYMTHELHYSDSRAFGLYALYTTLVEFGGVFGGLAADRFLGLKRSIGLGGWTIALGHLCLAVPGSQPLFFLGLGLIVSGTGLFRSNVAALLGEFYEEHDPRRDAGFTLYYSGINVGGFLATIFCGIAGEYYGWHAGFSLASLGMLSGNIALLLIKKPLEGKGEKAGRSVQMNFKGMMGLGFFGGVSALALYFHEVATVLFPFAVIGSMFFLARQMKHCTAEEKKGGIKLVFLMVFLILFYACEEQLGSTLVLFSERHVDRDTIFGRIPAASLTTLNPLVILAVGPIISKVLSFCRISVKTKIGASFILLGAAYFILYAGCLSALSSEGIASIGYALAGVAVIALGEILIGPTVFGTASENAPKNLRGVTMGLVTLGFSLANLLSGQLSQVMAITESAISLAVYSRGFLSIALAAFGTGAILLFRPGQFKNAMGMIIQKKGEGVSYEQ